jgi:hypothetical protein
LQRIAQETYGKGYEVSRTTIHAHQAHQTAVLHVQSTP